MATGVLFQFPVNCAGLVQELAGEAFRGVVQTVLDGTAFQNPMGASSDAMVSDIKEGAQTLIQNWHDSANDLADLNDILNTIGIAYEGPDDEGKFTIIETGGEPGGNIISNIRGAKDFADQLSGAGGTANEQSFMERVGVASAYNSLQQQINGQVDQFTTMFNLFGPQAQSLFNDTDTQVRAVSTLMRTFLPTDDLGAITGALDSISALTDDAQGLTSIVNGDNDAFQIASVFVQRAGLANIITGGNNCFLEDLIKKRPIGTDQLLENFQGAIDEKLEALAGVPEDALASIEALAAEKIEQIKSLGVQAEEIASMIGRSRAQTEVLGESGTA